MQQAPALTLTLQTDPRWRGSLRAGGACGLFTTLGWLVWHVAQVGAPDWPMLAVAAVSLIPPVRLLLQSDANMPTRSLSWHPAQSLWMLQPTAPDSAFPPRPGQVDCLVAGQDWLLLRHSGPHIPATWIPVSRRAHGSDWHALRCAVFSPGTRQSPATQANE
jgi:hypothetical protein